MIVEEHLKLRQPQGSKDCLATVVGMVTGDPLDVVRFKEYALRKHKNNGEQGYFVGEFMAFLQRRGYCVIKPPDVKGTPALVLVEREPPSIDETHSVYWTGHKVLDPDREEPCSLKDYTIVAWLPILKQHDNIGNK